MCLCPNKDRVRLFTEGVDRLSKWLEGGGKTNLELQYWIPKYIKYRGTRRFQDMGQMSPNMRALAVSQDKIGWRNFMEGRVSKEFYQMQAQHLASGTSFLNGEDWVKQLISRILHITHSQWIFRNFSLHDKRQGYLTRQETKDMMSKIETLLDTRPDEIPEGRKFLLEFNLGKLGQSTLDNKTYWVVAMEAAIKAGQRQAATGARRKRTLRKIQKKKSLRARFGIPEAEKEICPGKRPYAFANEERPTGLFRSETALTSLSRRQESSPASKAANLRSNKRHKPGD